MPPVRTPESSQTWQDARAVINATSALLASKRFQKTSIVSTIVAMSALSKFSKCCKPKREGSSLRGVSRITGLADNTVVSIVRAASQRAQMVHNEKEQAVETIEVSADELWSFVSKNKSNA